MPRLTKAAALAKAGYVPVIGRPKKEDTVQISFRLPVSLVNRLGNRPHKRAREIVLNAQTTPQLINVAGKQTKEPTVPISFRLPVSKAVKLGSKPHKRAREIVERELGGS